MTNFRRPWILLAVTASALFWASSVHADEELRDRYIAATQAMGENMLDVLRDCAPEIDYSGIDFEYSPEMTEAVGCVVEGHIERVGRDETVALVEEAEAMGQRSFGSLQDMTTMQEDYPRLSSQAMMELSQECGTIEASQDLPLSQLMRENMGELAACFSGQ